MFALGDVASTPNSKTAAAVRKQAPVVVRNLLRAQEGKGLDPGYDGYASCPLTTAYGKVMMAEFIYAGKVNADPAARPRQGALDQLVDQDHRPADYVLALHAEGL